MTTVRIDYPDDAVGEESEEIAAKVVAGSRARLDAHSTHIPLGPSDIVTINENYRVTGTGLLMPVWMFEVDFELPRGLATGVALAPEHAALAIIGRLRDEWSLWSVVTQTGPFTFRMSVGPQEERLDLFDASVVSSVYVKTVGLLRKPDSVVDFHQEVSTYSLDSIPDRYVPEERR